MFYRHRAALLLFAIPCFAQVCRLSVAGLNRDRRVTGEIATECPAPLHTAPFGNWGVTSNYGVKRDGNQFNGWCHESDVCDNNGNCRKVCRDGWYEWNSCTTHPQYRAPNCSLYNDAECTAQKSTQGINVHGTQTVEIRVRCPIDSNNDGVADMGGCADVKEYSHGDNFMSLYELDPVTGDSLIQSLYFPRTPVSLNCTAGGCPPAGSEWVQPDRWDSPAQPAKVWSEMATVVNSGTFVDSQRVCRMLVTVANTVSAASFRQNVAPASIATLSGANLAASTETGTGAMLPFTVAGSRVFVTDSLGARRPAGILYASPSQINYVVPPGTEPGNASLAVESDQGIRAIGSLQVREIAPAVFAANGSGSGRPAGLVIRRDARGNDTVGSPSDPIQLVAGTETFLAIYATGVRARPGAVQVRIAEDPVEVLWTGPHPEVEGLDQINVRVPQRMSGRGEVDLEVSVSNTNANVLKLFFR